MHDKLTKVVVKSQSIGEFLEWLYSTKKAHLVTYHEHTKECYEFGDKTTTMLMEGKLICG